MSIVRDIPDVLEPLAVERLARAELIEHIRKLEALRSGWELRVRVCEEREQLLKHFVSELGHVLANTFQSGHDAISEQADRTGLIMDQMRVAMQKVDAL